MLIGVCVPLFNVGAVWPMARHAQTGSCAQLVRNPLIIATASGLAVNLLGLRIAGLAGADAVTRIGAASLRAGPDGRRRRHAVRHPGARQGAGRGAAGDPPPAPAAGGRSAWSRLLRLEPAQTTVLLAFSALPTASSAYVLAARMGYNGAYVAGLVTLSTCWAC